MKKKIISILGSTGSIGTTSLKIIKKQNKKFEICLLLANKNKNKISHQIKYFKPKYFVINDTQTFNYIKKKFNNSKTIILNSLNLNKSFKKNNFIISAVPGFAGLEPTLKFLKHTKKLLIANKESIICGWDIIKSMSKKHKVELLPLDSEHYSIYKLLSQNKSDEKIDKVYLTASGGPFLNWSKKKIKNAKPSDAIKHPKWSMGKKISVDSATLMNKILEKFEAQKFFSLKEKQVSILIHPQSLVHAIIKFKSGISKFLYHEPNMAIPIASAISGGDLEIEKLFKTKNFDHNLRLDFFSLDKKKFPITRILDKERHISSPIIINAANEILVDNFLNKKISFNCIYDYLFIVLKDKNYKKYAIQRVKNLNDIYKIDKWAREITREIILKNEKY